MLSCMGGGKLSRLVYLAPHPPGYQSKSIVPILLILNYLKLSERKDVSIIYIIQVKFSCFFVRLFCMLSCRGGGGWGGKLSRPVYLDPHLPKYQSKIILLSFLI